MTGVTEAQVLAALRHVADAERGGNVVDLGMISGLVVKGSNIGFVLEVDPKDGAAKEPLRQACEQAVAALSGVTSATVVKIGRASCRERVCQYVSLSVVAETLKKNPTQYCSHYTPQ